MYNVINVKADYHKPLKAPPYEIGELPTGALNKIPLSLCIMYKKTFLFSKVLDGIFVIHLPFKRITIQIVNFLSTPQIEG